MTSAASSVSSASAVQARTPRRPVGCQVPCCGADEQSMPDYNKRVHVCEVHAKAPIVRGAHGNLLRFCQQCSKLQPLVEFKGQQRSCMAAQAKRRERQPLGPKRKRPKAEPASSHQGSPRASASSGSGAAGSREPSPAHSGSAAGDATRAAAARWPASRAALLPNQARHAFPVAASGPALPATPPTAIAAAHAGQAAQLAPQQLGWAAAPPLPPLKDLLARMPLLPEQPLPAPPSMAVGAALAPAAPRVLPWAVPLLPPPPLLPRGVPLPLPWAVPPPPPALEPLGVPLPPLPPLRDLPLGPLEQLHHEDELDLSILLTGEPDALVDMLQEFDDVLMDYLVAQPAALPIAQPPPPAQPAQHSTDSSADRFSAFDR